MTRTCEMCDREFGPTAKETVAAFKNRRFCGRVCSGKGRRKTPLPEPAVSAARYVDGVWRPDAPGFPDRPVVPGLVTA